MHFPLSDFPQNRSKLVLSMILISLLSWIAPQQAFVPRSYVKPDLQSRFLSSELHVQEITSNDQALNLLSHSQEVPQKWIVCLVGIPGCGKSTFAQSIICNNVTSSSLKWLITCQDVLKTRKRVISTARSHLTSNENSAVIIDRCNFDVIQRKHWLDLASEFRNAKAKAKTLCIVLPFADDVNRNSKRAIARGNDGVHKGDENWMAICKRLKHCYIPPSELEGFDGIFYCDEDEYSLDKIKSALLSL
jgi:predicted kinase